MAEANVEASASCPLRIYDEDDEVEIFSIELMYNVMKYFEDANAVVLPRVPRRSEYYSESVLKGVVLGWHITHDNLARRFRKAFPFMSKNREQLFSYAACQAAELFDNMLWYAQLIFLGAYCYELSCFLIRNGLEDYIYLSYTLFSTLWKDQYEKDFCRVNGWDNLDEALTHHSRLLKPLEDLFLPRYLFDFDDMQAVLMEYEIVKGRKEAPRDEVEKEIKSIFGELDDRCRSRVVTVEDKELNYLQYVMNFSTLRFIDVPKVFTPKTLIEYLIYRAVSENNYRGRQALLDKYDLEDYDPTVEIGRISTSPSDSEESNSKQSDTLTEGCQERLEAMSIRDSPRNVDCYSDSYSNDPSIVDVSREEVKTTTGGATPKKRTKSDDQGMKSESSSSKSAGSDTEAAGGASPKKKAKSDDQVKKVKQESSSLKSVATDLDAACGASLKKKAKSEDSVKEIKQESLSSKSAGGVASGAKSAGGVASGTKAASGAASSAKSSGGAPSGAKSAGSKLPSKGTGKQ